MFHRYISNIQDFAIFDFYDISGNLSGKIWQKYCNLPFLNFLKIVPLKVGIFDECNQIHRSNKHKYQKIEIWISYIPMISIINDIGNMGNGYSNIRNIIDTKILDNTHTPVILKYQMIKESFIQSYLTLLSQCLLY